MIDKSRLIDTFCNLVRIDSPSGHESEIALYLQKWLVYLGLSATIDDYGNVIGSTGGENPLLISAHMDTVEPGRNVKPIIDGDWIVSDGTTILGGDCKAAVASVLEAITSIKDAGNTTIPIEIAFTVQEEIGLLGAQNLDFSKIMSREAVVFDGEGASNQITSSSPTYKRFDVDITGRSAHAGVEPEKGLSAILVASDIVNGLPQGRLDEESTFNIGTIQGGTVRNAVPEKVTLMGEFRSRNLKTLEGMSLILEEVLSKTRMKFPEASIEYKLDTAFEGYSISQKEPVVRRVTEALNSLNMEPIWSPSGGGTDGNVFMLQGISAIVVGMADHNAHTTREYVSISEMVDTARLCEALLSRH